MLRTPLLMPKNHLKWLVYKPFGQLCIPILWFCKTARQSERAYNDSYSFDNKRTTRRPRPPHGNVDGVSIAKLPTKSTDNVRSPNWLPAHIAEQHCTCMRTRTLGDFSFDSRYGAHWDYCEMQHVAVEINFAKLYAHTQVRTPAQVADNFCHNARTMQARRRCIPFCHTLPIHIHTRTTHALHARTCLHYTREYNLREHSACACTVLNTHAITRRRATTM